MKWNSDRDLEIQLQGIAGNLEVQSEINAINQEFLKTEMTEMDGLT